MAYAAVISLKHTIQRLLNSSHIPIVSSTREIIEFAYEEVKLLQQVLKRSDYSSSSKRLDTLDGQIREAVHKFEDLLESHESDLLLSRSESYGDEGGSSHILSVDFEDVMRQEINSFAEMAKKMEVGFSNDEEEEDDDDNDDAAASSDLDVEMVGYSDDELINDVKRQTLSLTRPFDFCVYSIVGVTGTGRTYLAHCFFEQVYRKEQSFDCGAWVTIGPGYQFKHVLLHILAQILDHDDPDLHVNIPEEKIAELLHASLEGRKYIIVLDDVWDTQVWDDLGTWFPRQDNGSLILLTSSQIDVAKYARSFHINETQVLDNEDVNWEFFRQIMFGVDCIPDPELKEAGKKIVRNCGGLTISIYKVFLYLLNADKSPQYWNRLAADTKNSIFTVAHELSEMSQIKEDLFKLLRDNAEPVPGLNNFFKLIEMGFSIETEFTKERLFPKRFFPKMKLISFIGMAGIGKTTLVKKIFKDREILYHFDHHAWVTLGPKYQSKDIVVDILAQIYPEIDKMDMKRDVELAKDLCARLSDRRCLIVLDDLRNEEPLHYLKKLFPDIKGKALVTTRLAEVELSKKFDHVHEMCLLNKEESWCLLCEKVFAKDSCPPELEKAGKKIAEICDGLPLTIVTVGNFLSKAEKTPEYWNDVVERKNSLFMNAYCEISKALLPSYKSLPQHLKACVLYMGVFPQNYEIPTSKLINFWIAEGFLEPNLSQTVEEFAAECLSEIVDRSLLMVCRKGSNFRVKTCRLHSVFWYLSNSEAVKNKFFNVFNTNVEESIESIKNQRRLCIRNNILFGIKDVHNSMTSISTARSLLCTGPHHPYPIPTCLNFRLLRVLEALTIRFYEFPIEVVKLIHLRYLALTCNGKLPASISKLWNLHFLIVSRSLSIKSSGDSLCLPMEIWDMKELKHLQITGSNLPIPIYGTVLPNLLTLLDVSAYGCNEEVFKGIPNLKRLGIQIELAPDDDGKSFHCLNHISSLNRLESLKCVVVNPELKPKVDAPPTPVSMFPSGLKKLSLSGLECPWEYMSVLGKLKNLEVLKLRCYAFRGREWETGDHEFMKLKYLLIEDTDLVCWKHTYFNFHALKHLSIRHCYELEELPNNFMSCVEMIEVVDCNPFAVTWAKQIILEQRKYSIHGHSDLKPHVQSSWDSVKSQTMTARRFEETITSIKNEMSLQLYKKAPQRLIENLTGTAVQGKEGI